MYSDQKYIERLRPCPQCDSLMLEASDGWLCPGCDYVEPLDVEDK